MNKNQIFLRHVIIAAIVVAVSSMVSAMANDGIKYSEVTIINSSNSPIKVAMKKNKSDVTFHVPGYSKQILGRVGELADVSYQIYGYMSSAQRLALQSPNFGTASVPVNHPIDLTKATPGKNLKITISTLLDKGTEKYEIDETIKKYIPQPKK